ncbi:hypothetical protein [Antrihabitans cavernicola]|uniref:Ig-like domain-containing protein n=1 Tax=Antrihabitans cavernicola TaxID=2495913 RepID=A0A5A7SA17_9NOCA|nr:hypothetical protein [Spelaeibacter cavernicola]KAA0022756.1 hypothetical protein FOY51_13865 [Spelaeibacter cavernicola]
MSNLISRTYATSLAAAALTAGAVLLPGTAAAATIQLAAAGPDCLWAGGSHPQGQTVIAGGWTFTCAGGQWAIGDSVNQVSSVPDPGTGAPASGFSPGAMQPGGTYDAYCSGDQYVNAGRFAFRSDGSSWLPYPGPVNVWNAEAGTGPAVTPADGECRDGSII